MDICIHFIGRPQYADDMERSALIDESLMRLAECANESPLHAVTAGGRSSSRELSGTLKVMKRVEQVFQGWHIFTKILFRQF